MTVTFKGFAKLHFCQWGTMPLRDDAIPRARATIFVIKIDSSLAITRVIFRNDCPLLCDAARCTSPQSQYRLISNALTSHRSGALRRGQRASLSPASSYAGIKKKRRRRERPLQPPFSFAIKRKLARREKRRDAWADYCALFLRRLIYAEKPEVFRFLVRLCGSIRGAIFLS